MNTLVLFLLVGVCASQIFAAPVTDETKKDPKQELLEKILAKAADVHKKVHDSAFVGIAKEKAGEAINKVATNPFVIKGVEKAGETLTKVAQSEYVALGAEKAGEVLQKVSESEIGGKIIDAAEPFVQAAVQTGCSLAKTEGLTAVSTQCENAAKTGTAAVETAKVAEESG